MKKTFILYLSILLSYSSNAQIDTSLNSAGPRINTTIVSDESWMESTVTATKTALQSPWPGAPSFPDTSTYTLAVDTGKTYSYYHINRLSGCAPIVAGSDIHFYRKTFFLDSLQNLNFRVQMYMDDDAEILLNGKLIALESDVTTSNFKGLPHDLVFNNDSTVYNGFQAHKMFDFVGQVSPSDFLQPGKNEIIIAIRNLEAGNKGGFTCRMDISQTPYLNPLGAPESESILNNINFYPNPVHDKLAVECPNMGNQQVTLSIYNADGGFIKKKIIDPGQLNQVDLSNLTAGLYLLQFSDGKTEETRKLLIQ